jgi:hypothetical protein
MLEKFPNMREEQYVYQCDVQRAAGQNLHPKTQCSTIRSCYSVIKDGSPGIS